MNILVTGGSGFIGCNLIRYILANTDHSMVNVDSLTYAGNVASTEDFADSNRYCFEQADIADENAIKTIFERHEPDAIMHLAAESHVDRSITGPGAFIRTNVQGTYNLLEQTRTYLEKQSEGDRRNFRFLHVSTDEVFGSLGPTGYFTEETPYDPRSPYSSSKAASDHLARAWHHTYGLPVLITNCSNNYGPYQFPEKLIPVVILKALSGKTIPIYGKGENVRDWLYVEDHASALYKVLTEGQVGETYNIGGNNERKNIELVETICKTLDELRPAEKPYRDQIEFVIDRPGHDMRYAIDASKIKNDLGWEPQTNCENGIRKTVQWYLENKSWWQNILNGSYKLSRQGLIEN